MCVWGDGSAGGGREMRGVGGGFPGVVPRGGAPKVPQRLWVESGSILTVDSGSILG